MRERAADGAALARLRRMEQWRQSECCICISGVQSSRHYLGVGGHVVARQAVSPAYYAFARLEGATSYDYYEALSFKILLSEVSNVTSVSCFYRRSPPNVVSDGFSSRWKDSGWLGGMMFVMFCDVWGGGERDLPRGFP